MKLPTFVGLLAILSAPSMGIAQAQSPTPKISQEQASKIALGRIPGKVTSIAIERKRGKNVYVVEIQTPDGDEKDVFVDTQSGEIVGTD